jgi:hypothetical protein
VGSVLGVGSPPGPKCQLLPFCCLIEAVGEAQDVIRSGPGCQAMPHVVKIHVGMDKLLPQFGSLVLQAGHLILSVAPFVEAHSL